MVRKNKADKELEQEEELWFGHSPRKPVRENLDEPSRHRSETDKMEYHPVVHYYIEQTDLSSTEIAKIVGIDRKAVDAMKAKSHREAMMDPTGRVQKGWENDRVNAEIMRLHYEELSYIEIAEQVGLSWQTVRSRLSKEFAKNMEKKREFVAGRQYADLEVLRNELLEVILNTKGDSFDASDAMEMLADGRVADLIEMVEKKAKKSQDARFKAMELLLKTMEREGKLFGVDQNNLSITHTMKIEPESIELLQRIKKTREIEDVVEAEVVEDFDMTGGLM